MNIRQPEITAAIAICQLRVVESEQMKQRRIHIVGMDRVDGCAVSEIVGVPMLFT